MKNVKTIDADVITGEITDLISETAQINGLVRIVLESITDHHIDGAALPEALIYEVCNGLEGVGTLIDLHREHLDRTYDTVLRTPAQNA